MDIRCIALISLALVSGACGGDVGPDAAPLDGGGDDPDAAPLDSGGPDGGASDLTCSTYGWCTSYGPSDQEITDPPPLTGGAIPDGLYRLQRGWGPDALAFEGSKVVIVGDGFANHAGTWATSGGRLTLTMTTACDSDGERESVYTAEYDYAVQGDKLYVLGVGSPFPELGMLERLTSLCAEHEDFQCDVIDCYCVERVGETLADPYEVCRP